MKEMKPCPFCGETQGAFLCVHNQGTKWGYYECSCGARGPEVRTEYDCTEDADWHENAVDEWNERSMETDVNRFIDDLTAIAEADIDSAIAFLEENEAAHKFFDTLAEHCGASRKTFCGHTVHMILGLFK